MNAEQAKFLAEHYARVLEQEVPTTAKVLAAVNHGNRDYKPDPKSRSAFELASHIAVADNWFLQSVLDGKFEFDQEAATKAESQFKNADEIAAKAKALGGTVMKDKTEVMGMGWLAIIVDPTGAMLGLWKAKQK